MVCSAIHVVADFRKFGNGAGHSFLVRSTSISEDLEKDAAKSDCLNGLKQAVCSSKCYVSYQRYRSRQSNFVDIQFKEIRLEGEWCEIDCRRKTQSERERTGFFFRTRPLFFLVRLTFFFANLLLQRQPGNAESRAEFECYIVGTVAIFPIELKRGIVAVISLILQAITVVMLWPACHSGKRNESER